MRLIKNIKRFIKYNKVISVCFATSFAIIVLYIFSLNETEWFPHAGDWFTVLFQLSIGFVINFIFYVTQVYIPRQNLSRQANRCIQERIQNVVDKMDDIFRRIVDKYESPYNKQNMTSEKILEILHKIKTLDRINVVAAKRSGCTREAWQRIVPLPFRHSFLPEQRNPFSPRGTVILLPNCG